MEELRAIIALKKPHIVAVTETWTNDAHGDALLNVQDFELVARRDRSDTEGGRGGGIALWARKEICAWRTDETTDFNQCISVKIRCRCEDIMLHCVYRSPNSSKDNDAKLCKWVNEMWGTNILIGDFNFPDID